MSINKFHFTGRLRKDMIEKLCENYNLEYDMVSQVCIGLGYRLGYGVLETVEKLNVIIGEELSLEYLQKDLDN